MHPRPTIRNTPTDLLHRLSSVLEKHGAPGWANRLRKLTTSLSVGQALLGTFLGDKIKEPDLQRELWDAAVRETEMPLAIDEVNLRLADDARSKPLLHELHRHLDQAFRNRHLYAVDLGADTKPPEATATPPPEVEEVTDPEPPLVVLSARSGLHPNVAHYLAGVGRRFLGTTLDAIEQLALLPESGLDEHLSGLHELVRTLEHLRPGDEDLQTFIAGWRVGEGQFVDAQESRRALQEIADRLEARMAALPEGRLGTLYRRHGGNLRSARDMLEKGAVEIRTAYFIASAHWLRDGDVLETQKTYIERTASLLEDVGSEVTNALARQRSDFPTTEDHPLLDCIQAEARWLNERVDRTEILADFRAIQRVGHLMAAFSNTPPLGPFFPL